MAAEKMTITKNGSYNTKTGNYSITDNKTGKTITGTGSQDDYEKAYNSTGGNNSSSSGSSSKSLSSSNYDIASQIEKLRQAQTDAAISSLGKARDTSLSNLTSERAKIEPLYYGKRNSASTGSQLNAKNFAEYMASRGGTSSGTNAQAELSRQGALQGQIGSLNRDEASAFTENDRQVTNVNNAYENDVASAKADIYAQSLQNYINQLNADRAYNQQNYQFDTSTGLQRDQFNQNLALQKAGLTGNIDGQQTLQAKTAQQDQEYRLATLDLQRQAQKWQQDFQERGFTADEAYRMAQLKLQQDQQALDEKYRYAALSKSGSSGGSRGSGLSVSQQTYNDKQSSIQATSQAMDYLNKWANGQASDDDGQNIGRATRDGILSWVNNNAGQLNAQGVDVNELYKWADNTFLWNPK